MDKTTFGNLVIASEISLYRVAKSILRDDEDCADAIGEAITTAFTKLSTLKEDAFAKTWLIRILINECYRLGRYAQRTGQYEELDEQIAATGQDYSELYEALGQLAAKDRLVMVLHYMEGYSVKETAKMLHISESAVKNRMLRSRGEMRRYMEVAYNE